MKKIILILAAVIIFFVFNYGIYQKEKIKSSDDIVYLKLAPIDPRSLMQGDYMEFSYTIVQGKTCGPEKKSGYIVIKVGENHIGAYERCYAGETLHPQEKLLRYHQLYWGIRIVPDSFMFQEGLAPLYEKAKYGVFKFSGDRDYLLVGLADDKLQIIRNHQ